MADILQIPTIAWKSDPNDAVTGNRTDLSAHVPDIARERAEILAQSDTFTREFSSSSSPPHTEPQLDLDRLQPKPKSHRRFHLRAMLSVVVICSILAPIAYLLLVQRLVDWRPALEWLVASIDGQVGGSKTQQELSADAENSGVANAAVNVQSSEDRTDKTTSTSASASTPVETASRQDVQPHDAQRDDQRGSTAMASTQSETPSLQRPTAGENSNSCTSKQPVEADFVLPYRAVASYGSKEPAQLDAAAISLLVKRGQDLFENGDLIGARTAFRRAAEAGNADAALAMGATYDPIEFLALGVQGVDADITETRRWYETAKRLGSAEASQRLDALSHY